MENGQRKILIAHFPFLILLLPPIPPPMNDLINLKAVAASFVYSFIGIFILIISFWIIERLTPEDLWREILVNKNMALALMAGAFMLAVAIIIGFAIHG
jgi:uncharacterized membrane protein YjfL (UPF0719 family)